MADAEVLSYEETEKRAEMPTLTPPPAVEAEPGSDPPDDKLIEKIEKPAEKWVMSLIKMVPPVNYEMDLSFLAGVIRETYKKHAVQPAYSIVDNKPGTWLISQHPQEGTRRIPFKEFAPNMRSVKLKQRMYDAALFARWRMMLNATLGTVISALLHQYNFQGFVFTDKEGNVHRVRGSEVNIGMLPDEKAANPVNLVWDGGRNTTPLDPMVQTQMGVVLARAGGGSIFIDVAKPEPVSAHHSLSVKNSMNALLVFENSSMMIRRVAHMKQVLLMVIAETTAAMKNYNAEKKAETKRRRRKKRRNKKKKKNNTTATE